MIAARVARLAALLPWAAGCSTATDEMPYEGACPPFNLLSSSPGPGQDDVPINARIEIRFSDYPDPDSVSVGTFLLTSGPFRRTGRYGVDLLDRVVRYTPVDDLQQGLTYAVSISRWLRSTRGCPSDRDEQRLFRTGTAAGPDPPAPAPVTWSRVLTVFQESCWGARCHRDAPPGDPRGCGVAPASAPRGLSLCDDAAYESLVGRPSAEIAWMRLVEPRDAARSYLLRKLLPSLHGEGPMPGTPGARMPAAVPGEPSRDPLPPATLRLISDWIDGGAER